MGIWHTTFSIWSENRTTIKEITSPDQVRQKYNRVQVIAETRVKLQNKITRAPEKIDIPVSVTATRVVTKTKKL